MNAGKGTFGKLVDGKVFEYLLQNTVNTVNVNVTYYNLMRRPIGYKDYFGICASVDCDMNYSGPEEILVRVKHTFNRNALIDDLELRKYLDNTEKAKVAGDILNQIGQIKMSMNNYHLANEVTYFIKYTKAQIDAAGGCIYLNEFDIMLGYFDVVRDTPHERSAKNIVKGLEQSLDSRACFSLGFMLVDNHHQVGCLWLNTGVDHKDEHGHNCNIHRVDAIQSNDLESGVYYTYTVPQGKEKIPKTIYATLEDAERVFGLYGNRIEAATLGSPTKRNEMNLQELKDEIARKNLELAMHKQRVEEDQRLHNQREAELKHEWDKLATARERAQEEEARARAQEQQRRKETGEWNKTVVESVKQLGAMATVILSIVALVVKIKA